MSENICSPEEGRGRGGSKKKKGGEEQERHLERSQRRQQRLSAKLTTTLTTLLCSCGILAVLVANKGLVSNSGRHQQPSEELAASAVNSSSLLWLPNTDGQNCIVRRKWQFQKFSRPVS